MREGAPAIVHCKGGRFYERVHSAKTADAVPRPHEGEHDEDVVAKRHTGQTDRARPPTKHK